MLQKAVLIAVLSVLWQLGFGQTHLRDSVMAVTTFQFGYSANLTAGNLSEKTDLLNNIMPSLCHKNRHNWTFELGVGALLGTNALETNTPAGIYSEVGIPISTEGVLEQVKVRFQGYTVQFQTGKLIVPSRYNKNTGLWLCGGLGYMRHKLRFVYKGSNVPQLNDPYVKGYDRLTNGLALNQFIGYRRYSNKNNFNFSFGLEIVEGFTKNRRSWNYDVFGPLPNLRHDIYYGLKFNLLLPFYD
ncbi:hypothetical protein GC194_06325 [bacterium]|nr:hypothetical protein [bacterium]